MDIQAEIERIKSMNLSFRAKRAFDKFGHEFCAYKYYGKSEQYVIIGLEADLDIWQESDVDCEYIDREYESEVF